MESGLTRRQILTATMALAPVAMGGCAATRTSPRESKALMLEAGDPVARTVGYFPNTRAVPADHPLAATHDPAQRCAGCLRQRGPAGDGALYCPTFPGRLVSEDGWCSLWTDS